MLMERTVMRECEGKNINGCPVLGFLYDNAALLYSCMCVCVGIIRRPSLASIPIVLSFPTTPGPCSAQFPAS